MAELAQVRHVELLTPEPIAELDVRDRSLWIGTVPVAPTPTSPTEPVIFPAEHIFRVPGDRAAGAFSSPQLTLLATEAVLTGTSEPGPNDDPYTTPGLWLSGKFDSGDPTINFPAPPRQSAPRADAGHDSYSTFPGFVYTGPWWSWKDPSGRDHRINTEELAGTIARRFGRTPSLGPLQLVDAASIQIASILAGEDGRTTLLITAIPVAGDDQSFSFGATPVDVAGDRLGATAALHAAGAWWIPALSGDPARPDSIALWRFNSSGLPSRFGQVPALLGFASPSATTSFLERIHPADPRSMPLQSGAFLFGYVGDSLYLVNPRTGRMRSLFYPIQPGLRIAELGSSLLLLWMQNGRKSYLVDAAHD